jgi:hypothetical protein
MTRRATPQPGADRMVKHKLEREAVGKPRSPSGARISAGLRAASPSNIIMSAIKTARVRVVGLLFLLPSNTVSTVVISVLSDGMAFSKWVPPLP